MGGGAAGGRSTFGGYAAAAAHMGGYAASYGAGYGAGAGAGYSMGGQRAMGGAYDMGGQTRGRATQPSASFIGLVKSYNEEKGWGFVTSDVVLQLYGKDVLFRKNGLAAGPVRPGQQVSFAVVQGDKGPLAENVQLFGMPAMPYYAPSPAPAYGGFQQMAMSGGGKGSSKGGVAKTPSKNERFFGTVRTYSEEKGWGHIECPAAFACFGKDIFLLRSAVNGQKVGPGSQVSFKANMGPKGPQANDVALLPPGSFGSGEEPGSIYSGIVKSFNEDKGWGFATSDDIQQIFGKDIFLHRRELGESKPSVGDAIQFSVEQGPSGQLEAKSVSFSGQVAIGGYGAEHAGHGGFRSSPY